VLLFGRKAGPVGRVRGNRIREGWGVSVLGDFVAGF